MTRRKRRAPELWVSLRMADILETKDRFGRPVRIGNRVRVISLSQELLDSLPEDERPLVTQMINGIFEVDEIDQWGAAWVTKSWARGNEEYDAHGIGLAPSEMELAVDAD